MGNNDIEPPENSRSFSMAAGVAGSNWRAQLYVTFMIWRRVGRAHHATATSATATRLSDTGRTHMDMAPGRMDSPSDGPWDDLRRKPRPIRALILIAALLLVAWLTADAAVRLLTHIDIARLASGS